MKHFLLSLGTAVFLVSCAAFGGLSSDPYPAQDRAIVSGILPNGFTYFIRPNAKPENRAYISLVVRAGSFHENDDERGLAHFVEHMAFNGTERFDKNAVIEYFDNIGMRFGDGINAYTSFEETVYHLEIPLDKPEIIDTSLDILEDWSRALTFDPAEVEREKGVIEEEWRLGRDVNGRRRDFMLPLLFNGSRWADRLPIGDIETIRTATPEKLRSFYRSWYRPERMALVVVGAVDPALWERKIEDGFSWTPEGTVPLLPVPDIAPFTETSVHVFSDPEQRYNVLEAALMEPVKSMGWRESRRRELLYRMTKAAIDQRLTRLTEAEEPPFLAGFVEFQNLVRRFQLNSLYVVAQPGRWEDGFTALLRETEKVRQLGFTPRELERERSALLQELTLLNAQAGDRAHPEWASDMVNAWLNGTPVPSVADFSATTREILESLSLADWNSFASDMLRLDNRRLLLSANPGLGAVPETPVLLGLMATIPGENFSDSSSLVIERLLPQAPAPGNISHRRRWESMDVSLWELDNGAKLYWKKTDFKTDEILIRAYRPGGLSLAEDNQLPQALWTTDYLSESGLGPWTNAQLTDFLADKNMSFELSAEEAAVWLNGQSTRGDLETWFQLLHLRLTAMPDNPPSFRSVKSRLLTMAQSRAENPQTRFQDFLSVLFRGGESRSQVLTPEAVRSSEFEAVRDWDKRLFGSAAGWTFVVAGDFDPVELERLVKQYVASIPSGNAEAFRDRATVPTATGRRILRAGNEAQATTVVVYPSNAELTLAETIASQAMSEILNIRLRESVREELGGTYSIGFDFQCRPFPSPSGLAYAHFGSSPDKAESLAVRVRLEIEKLLREPVTDREVATFREIRFRDLETAQRTNAFWAGNILNYDYSRRDLNVLPAFMERIRAVTPELVLQVARKVLLPERSFEAVHLPAAQP